MDPASHPAAPQSGAVPAGDDELRGQRTRIIVRLVTVAFMAAVLVFYFSWRRSGAGAPARPAPPAIVGKAASVGALQTTPWTLASDRL